MYLLVHSVEVYSEALSISEKISTETPSTSEGRIRARVASLERTASAAGAFSLIQFHKVSEQLGS
jgi:hypothetical protein